MTDDIAIQILKDRTCSQEFRIPSAYDKFLTFIGLKLKDIDRISPRLFANLVLKALERVSKTALQDWKEAFDQDSEVKVEDVVKVLSNVCAACLIADSSDIVRISVKKSKNSSLTVSRHCCDDPDIDFIQNAQGSWIIECYNCGRCIESSSTFFNTVKKWNDCLVKDV